jgi:threonylcarbamoyladenosine tRNA methylthiotransferase MtaB
MKRKALFESKNKDGLLEGWTDNYIKVVTPFKKELINKVIPVGLIEIDEAGRLNVELN